MEQSSTTAVFRLRTARLQSALAIKNGGNGLYLVSRVDG
jgi:hypothetical protein